MPPAADGSPFREVRPTTTRCAPALTSLPPGIRLGLQPAAARGNGGFHMKTRRLTLALSALALAAASFAANADILFQNLGTAAPPATLGGHTMTQFDQSPQAAIPDGTSGIALIPGAPMGGTLGISAAASKFTVGNGWGTSETWGHGYLGPVFYSTSNPVTLTLPAGTKAFYFYTQSSWVGTWNITATTDSGTR